MDNRTYRSCVRVLVVNDGKVLIATKTAKDNGVTYFEFPGGGIEEGETIEEAAIKECLEEVGVLINNVCDIGVEQTYDINYLKPERAKMYKGAHDVYVSADYIRKDGSKFDLEDDGMKWEWKTIDTAIHDFKNGPDSMFTPTSIEALEKLKARLKDKRGYRQCIRVIIVNGKEILLGKKYVKGEFVGYEFPGGGLEGDDINTAVVKECLEEVGIQVKNPKALGVEYQYDIDYPKPERAKLYRGGRDIWMTAEFVRKNTELHDSEGDALPYSWETIEKAREKIHKGPKSRYNAARLEALDRLEDFLKHKKSIKGW